MLVQFNGKSYRLEPELIAGLPEIAEYVAVQRVRKNQQAIKLLETIREDRMMVVKFLTYSQKELLAELIDLRKLRANLDRQGRVRSITALELELEKQEMLADAEYKVKKKEGQQAEKLDRLRAKIKE